MGAGQDHVSKQLELGATGSCKLSHLEEIRVDEPSSTITRKVWLDSWEKKWERTESRRAEMHKVPDQFVANVKSKSYYTPKVVSLGPYHRADDKLQLFKNHKLLAVDRLIPNKELQAKLKREIMRNIGMMKAYSEETKNDCGQEEMLFLDGCFVLHFVFCIVYDRVEDLKMKKYEIESVHHDLFLLENQLPYKLLKILSGNDPELLDLICEYICTYKVSNDNGRGLKLDEPAHLLDCLRTIIIGRRSEPQKWQREIQPLCQLPAWPSAPAAGTKGTVIRHAKELTAKGIFFKPNRSGFSKDIYFRSHFIYGTLRLPRIVVDDATRPLFLNLAAYEMCAGIDSVITSYICFLDSLVNHAEDIKELQSAGILVNHLPTDEDAANLFNEMPEGLHPDMDAFMDVKRKIQKFFDDKTKASIASWIAEGYHNHFKSPLTTMAVLAAFLALGLAATQTYFTIFPRGDK